MLRHELHIGTRLLRLQLLQYCCLSKGSFTLHIGTRRLDACQKEGLLVRTLDACQKDGLLKKDKILRLWHSLLLSLVIPSNTIVIQRYWTENPRKNP